MQRLIDAAVMVVPMIVPSLRPQFGQKALHSGSLRMATRVGHEANIGIPLQAYYKATGEARTGTCVAGIRENFMSAFIVSSDERRGQHSGANRGVADPLRP